MQSDVRNFVMAMDQKCLHLILVTRVSYMILEPCVCVVCLEASLCGQSFQILVIQLPSPFCASEFPWHCVAAGASTAGGIDSLPPPQSHLRQISSPEFPAAKPIQTGLPSQ